MQTIAQRISNVCVLEHYFYQFFTIGDFFYESCKKIQIYYACIVPDE
jgi:hypothetical protein